MQVKAPPFSDLVAERLHDVEQRMLSSADQRHSDLDTAIKQLIASGGKRMRPIVVLLVGGMLGADSDRTATFAAAIEMLHTATLVHDDLIDGSPLRRGFPTLNANWNGGATVLMGDYLFALAAKLAAEIHSLTIMESFASTIAIIVNGELNQLLGNTTGDIRKDYFDRVYAKTGSLFEISAEGSAILAESDARAQARLADYGRQLGIAFQIVDDVFDYTGSIEQVGKPVASDLRNGVITLPAVLPSTVPGPYTLFMQAIMGATLTNLCVMEVN